MWNWLFEHTDGLFRPLTDHLHHHPLSAFRALLVSGNLLLIALLVSLQSTTPHLQHYYAWMAGLAATLGGLFVFAIISVRINGHWRYRDVLLGLATAMMLLFSVILAVASLS